MRAHEQGKHPSVPAQFGCEICGRRFNSKLYLSNHRQKVHKINAAGRPIDKPENAYNSLPGQFICDICGKGLNSRSYLWVHRRIAHKVNSAGNSIVVKPRKKEKRRAKPADPSTCHLCGKSFTWTDGLTKHLKHFHEKQFDKHCHVCGLGVYSNKLTIHLLSRHPDDPVSRKMAEEGTRLWRCTVVGCRVVYCTQSGLENHMKKLHGGEGNGQQDAKKRFSCSFCGKTFWYGYKLKRHESFHKAEAKRPYACEVCGARFNDMSYVKRHKTRFHKNIGTSIY